MARMAWRDSRGSRAHLLLSMAAMALGIAALVAIRSFSLQLDAAIQDKTRELLGADLSIRARQLFTPDVTAWLDTLLGRQVREVRFFSMARFPKNDGVRLCQIRALDGPFPFYGRFETEPPALLGRLLAGRGEAIAEESLIIQYDLAVGDVIELGEQAFTIIGTLRNIAGEAPASSTFVGPRIFIAESDLAATGLLEGDRLVHHHAHFQAPADWDVDAWIREQREQLSGWRLEAVSAAQRRELLGQAMTQLYRYLNLGAFAALLLGGIGLVGAIQLYVRKKRVAVAVLRCLGCPALHAFGITVIQTAAAALLGAAVGAVLGGALQYALPVLLADFLPVAVAPAWSVSALIEGVLFGLGLALVFALYPLLPLRRVPALVALQAGLADTGSRRPGVDQWLMLGVLAIVLTGFAVAHTDRFWHGLLLSGGIGLVFGLLAGAARLVMALARRLGRDAWPFTWRQGWANLHRPYNQTAILLLGLGLGAFLLSTLAFTQENIVQQFQRTDADGRPNMILFDIQPDQIEAVEAMTRDEQLDVVESVPIVTMRLTHVNGRSVGAIRDDATQDIPNWVLFREYRCTYREVLDEDEKVVAGRWEGRVDADADWIPVSIEEGMREHLKVGLGDRLIFNVQGMKLRTVVRSIRDVDWREMRTNFFVIFPAGVLEAAPQTFAMVARAPTPAESAGLQRAVVGAFPNVSTVDLRMVVATLDDILGKAAFVVRFMAIFCVFTGLWVLAGTVITSRYDRLEEVRLLRTLGASRSQLQRIMAAEYVLLGGVASVTGVGLGLLASAVMARGWFDMAFRPAAWPLWVLPLAITAATLAVGFLANRRLVGSRS
jgi:putative ABC transport system permease protein